MKEVDNSTGCIAVEIMGHEIEKWSSIGRRVYNPDGSIHLEVFEGLFQDMKLTEEEAKEVVNKLKEIK